MYRAEYQPHYIGNDGDSARKLQILCQVGTTNAHIGSAITPYSSLSGPIEKIWG